LKFSSGKGLGQSSQIISFLAINAFSSLKNGFDALIFVVQLAMKA
jgi:hypothetical protein